MTFDFLNECSNVFGELDDDIKRRLKSVIMNPTQDTWDDAHGILIKPNTTLWQAWVAIDSSAPRSKPLDEPWPKIPSTFQLYRAIKNTID